MTLKEFLLIKNTGIQKSLFAEQALFLDIVLEYWKNEVDSEVQLVLATGYSEKHRADKKVYNALKTRVSYYVNKYKNDSKGELIVNKILNAKDNQELQYIKSEFHRSDILYSFFDFNVETVVGQDDSNEELYMIERKRLVEILKLLVPYTVKNRNNKLSVVTASEIRYLRYVLSNPDHMDYDIIHGVLGGSSNENN